MGFSPTAPNKQNKTKKQEPKAEQMLIGVLTPDHSERQVEL